MYTGGITLLLHTDIPQLILQLFTNIASVPQGKFTFVFNHNSRNVNNQ